MATSIRYQCNACGTLAPRSQLKVGTWGDYCCAECNSPDVARYRTRFERWYAIFFLYKVY